MRAGDWFFLSLAPALVGFGVWLVVRKLRSALADGDPDVWTNAFLIAYLVALFIYVAFIV